MSGPRAVAARQHSGRPAGCFRSPRTA